MNLAKMEKQGPDYHPAENNFQKYKIYETAIYKTLDIRQQRTVISGRHETR